MLPNVGIILTFGTVDIGKCHLIKKTVEELKMRKEPYVVFNNTLKESNLQTKVSYKRTKMNNKNIHSLRTSL